MRCKAMVHESNNEKEQCSREAVIDGYCMNHYTLLVYNKRKGVK